MLNTNKYISRRYLKEKLAYIKPLINIIESDEGGDNLAEILYDTTCREAVFGFAVIAKELGYEIPTDI